MPTCPRTAWAHTTHVHTHSLLQVNGNTGEGMLLDVATRKHIVDIVVAEAKVRAFYPSAPSLCNGVKYRLCVLDRHYAGTA